MFAAFIHPSFKIWQVCKMALSFSSAKDLRSRIEMLPGGPKWLSKEMETESPTIDKVYLYYKNPLHCLQYILHNPLFSDHLQFAPYRLYQSIDKQIRLYDEWLSGDVSWTLQVRNQMLHFIN